MIKKSFISLLMMLISSFSFSQNPEWIIYTTSNSGLLHNAMQNVSIDTSNNVWLSRVYMGVVKYDGATWTPYTSSVSSFSTLNMEAIATDKNNNVFLGIYNTGIDRYDGTLWQRYNTPTPTVGVKNIAIDSSNNKWCATSGGLLKYNDTVFTVYDTANSSIPFQRLSAICVDKNENIWFTCRQTPEGVSKFDGTNWTLFTTSNSGISSNNVRAVKADNNNNLWIGTDAGLAKYNGSSWTIYNTSNSNIPSDYINSIAIDPNNGVWVGTGNSGTSIGIEGVGHFDGINWTKFTTANSPLLSNYIRDIAIDKYNNKWLVSGDGVAVYREGGVGIIEKQNAVTGVTVYPNPANNFINVEVALTGQKEIEISVFNLMGKKVLQETVKNSKDELQIDISHLQNGIYLINVKREDCQMSKRFVKQ